MASYMLNTSPTTTLNGETVSIRNVLTSADPIKYHSAVAKRLLQVTIDGLKLNGVDVPGIGDKVSATLSHSCRAIWEGFDECPTADEPSDGPIYASGQLVKPSRIQAETQPR